MNLGIRIGVFDSGVGGLTVLKALQQTFPEAHFVYYADSKHAPYGTLNTETIWRYSSRIVRYLMRREVDLIVVGCNTITTEVINRLRAHYVVPFVGIEPAIKPATKSSPNKCIGILATERTLNSKGYTRTRDQYAMECKVIERVGVGLVEEIEKGIIESAALNALVESFVIDFEEQAIDTLVLGCTHYILIRSLFSKRFKNPIMLLDANEAVARRAFELVSPVKQVEQMVECYTSGSTQLLRRIIDQLEINAVTKIERLQL
ncbi:MAG: glutamate racemase [Flavobacteriaceae bacterium]